jgi:hypothetical protein
LVHGRRASLKSKLLATLIHIRHPEVRAKRASKGDGIQVGCCRPGQLNDSDFGLSPKSAGRASFEGRFAATSG